MDEWIDTRFKRNNKSAEAFDVGDGHGGFDRELLRDDTTEYNRILTTLANDFERS